MTPSVIGLLFFFMHKTHAHLSRITIHVNID